MRGSGGALPSQPPGAQAAGSPAIFTVGLAKLPQELGSWKKKRGFYGPDPEMVRTLLLAFYRLEL